jgi:hypothetical protein
VVIAATIVAAVPVTVIAIMAHRISHRPWHDSVFELC